MKNHKVLNYDREFPSGPPLKFTSLTQREAETLGQQLINRAGLEGVSPIEMLRGALARAEKLPNVCLDEHEIELAEVLERCEVKPQKRVYIQWRLFEEVDEFDLDELKRVFYYVWYPIADDIELFDDSMRWIVFIEHHGAVSILRNGQDADDLPLT
jgi:hypothetical protein